MIPFMEKTWFLWWLLATVVILRWFHLLSSRATLEASKQTSTPRKESPRVQNRFRREPQVCLPRKLVSISRDLGTSGRLPKLINRPGHQLARPGTADSRKPCGSMRLPLWQS